MGFGIFVVLVFFFLLFLWCKGEEEFDFLSFYFY